MSIKPNMFPTCPAVLNERVTRRFLASRCGRAGCSHRGGFRTALPDKLTITAGTRLLLNLPYINIIHEATVESDFQFFFLVVEYLLALDEGVAGLDARAEMALLAAVFFLT